VLDPEQNGIFVAGAGDCRAVLGRKGTSGGWEMIEASFDHTLKREEEVARLKEEHPGEPQEVLTASGRVLGVLMPSRAFGDSDFKWPQETQKVLGSIPFPAKIYKSPPCELI
jgi:pyruvate dehydrogenase phosphatase